MFILSRTFVVNRNLNTARKPPGFPEGATKPSFKVGPLNSAVRCSILKTMKAQSPSNNILHSLRLKKVLRGTLIVGLILVSILCFVFLVNYWADLKFQQGYSACEKQQKNVSKTGLSEKAPDLKTTDSQMPKNVYIADSNTDAGKDLQYVQISDNVFTRTEAKAVSFSRFSKENSDDDIYALYDTEGRTYWTFTSSRNSNEQNVTHLITTVYPSNEKEQPFVSYLAFDNFDKSSCSLLPFLKSSQTMFMLCENSISDETAAYTLLGLVGKKNTNASSEKQLAVSLVKKITLNKDAASKIDSVESVYGVIHMVQVRPNTYYLLTPSMLYVIEQDMDNGSLSIVDEKNMKYYENAKGVDSKLGSLADIKANCNFSTRLHMGCNGRFIVNSCVDYVTAIDTIDNSIYPLGKSCKTNIPGRGEQFYNYVIDFTEGPYKSIYATDLPDTFEQISQNAGTVFREGFISLYKAKDVVECKINPEYKLLEY